MKKQKKRSSLFIMAVLALLVLLVFPTLSTNAWFIVGEGQSVKLVVATAGENTGNSSYSALAFNVYFLGNPMSATDLNGENASSPNAVEQIDSAGYLCTAIIYDSDGNEITGIEDSCLVISALNDSSVDDKEILERLNESWEMISTLETLLDVSENADVVLYQDYGVGYGEITSITLNYYFDLTLLDIYYDYMSIEGNYINVIFDTIIDPSAKILIMFYVEGEYWLTIEPERDFILLDDQMMQIIFQSQYIPTVVAIFTFV